MPIVVLALVVAAGLIGPSVAASEHGDNVAPPGADDFEDVLAGGGTEPPPEPSSPAERADSEMAYTGLSDAEALALARTEFDVITAPLFPELDLAEGQTVDRYLGPYTARLDQEGAGPGGIVESTLPLRAPEGGMQKPLDGELEAVGDHFEVDNAVIDTEVPVDLADGISTETAGTSVAPVSTKDAEPQEVADKLFYAGTDTDTDTLVAPLATGVEIFFQLRSRDSPESHGLDFELPQGGSLAAMNDGGAQIRVQEEVTADISPPRAWDAAGKPVPASYEVNAERLTISIPHREHDLLYPVLVDPVIDYYDGVPGSDWWTATNFDAGFDMYTGWGGDFANRALFSHTYADGSYGEWLVSPIRDSYIERVDFLNWSNAPTAPGSCSVAGIYGAGGWQTGISYNPATQVSTPASYINGCSTWSNQTRHFWVGTSPTPDGDGTGDAEASNGSLGVWALVSSAGSRSSTAGNSLEAANVYRYDRNQPTITSTPPSSAWRDDAGGMTISARDTGLGVYALNVWGTGVGPPNNSTNLLTKYAPFAAGNPNPCTGVHDKSCPQDWSTDITLPQGRTELMIQGYDVQGWPTAMQTTTQRIDRSGPDLELSGALDTEVDTYDLDASAVDGSAATAAQERAGVQSLAVSVDGVALPELADAQECPEGSCALNGAWQLDTADWTAGNHSVAVTATDQVGHAVTEQVAVQVPRNTSIDDGPVGIDDDPTPTFAFSSPNGGGFECKVDSGSWSTCTSPKTLGTQSDGNHTFAVRARGPSGAPDYDPTPADAVWAVDTQSPQTTVVGAPPTTTDQRTASVSFTSSESGSSFECRWDAETWAACSSPVSRSDLPDGDHSFQVRAIDLEGNHDPTPASATWSVDGEDPEGPICADEVSSEALEALEALDDENPSVIAPTESADWQDEAVDPSIDESAETGTLESADALTTSVISCELEDGLEMDTRWGALRVEPLEVDPAATEAIVVNDDAALFAGTAEDADTIVRPTAQGIASVTQIRSADAPETYRWKLTMPGGVAPELLDDGSVAILADQTPISAPPVNPEPPDGPPHIANEAGQNVLMDATSIPPGADGLPATPPDYEASDPPQPEPGAATSAASVPDVEQQLDDAAQALGAATDEIPEEDTLLATIDTPWAVDASGESVPVSLAVNDGVVEMTVDHSQGNFEYPIVADPDLIDCHVQPEPCGKFQPLDARRYASKWRVGRNPHYYEFDNHCTGFVSEALKAGGLKWMREWEKGDGSWWARKRPLFGAHAFWTHSWSVSGDLKHHLMEYGLARQIKNTERNWEPGDILFYKFSHQEGGSHGWDHTNIVHHVVGGRTGMPYLLQHDRDYAEPKPLKAFKAKADGISDIAHLRIVATGANID